ncbi:MAG TPA: SDR family oxidoreductase [Candidatus Binatia bacterium]|nr:SDR family oxidoreductase [Candidatus Binatia bacterium]
MTTYKMALITGASSGIGEEFARQLADRGSDLVLVARSEDKLRALAKQLAELHSRRVETVTLDLCTPGAAGKLREALQALKLTPDLLVNNAGFGTAGAFWKQDAAREQQEIALNVGALVDITRAFLPSMVEARHGGVLNVASLAGFQPLPYMAVYAATKAFVLSFSQSLRAELRGTGVGVVCLCPGPVDTPFFEATGVPGMRKTVPRGTMVTAEAVVSAALRRLDAGGGVVLPGAAAKLMAAGSRLVPHALLAATTARFMRR